MKWASSHTPFDSVIFLFNYVHIQLQHLLTLTWPLLYAFSFFSNTIRKTFFKSWPNHVINSQIGAIIWKQNACIFAKCFIQMIWSQKICFCMVYVMLLLVRSILQLDRYVFLQSQHSFFGPPAVQNGTIC